MSGPYKSCIYPLFRLVYRVLIFAAPRPQQRGGLSTAPLAQTFFCSLSLPSSGRAISSSRAFPNHPSPPPHETTAFGRSSIARSSTFEYIFCIVVFTFFCIAHGSVLMFCSTVFESRTRGSRTSRSRCPCRRCTSTPCGAMPCGAMPCTRRTHARDVDIRLSIALLRSNVCRTVIAGARWEGVPWVCF